MAKIKISRFNIEKAAAAFEALGKRTNNNKFFSFFIIRNVHHLIPEVQSINTIRNSMSPSDRVVEYEDKRVNLAKSLCEKDENGDPSYTVNEFGKKAYKFSDENRVIFNEKFKELSKEYADDLTEFEASVNEFSFLMNEEIEVDINKIAFKYIPDDVDISDIFAFIEEPSEEIDLTK